MEQTLTHNFNHFPTRPFVLLLVALAVLAGVSLLFTAWCWPRLGESACGRYVLPIDFLMSMVIFALVALVFDQSWGRLILFCILIAAVIFAGNLVARLIHSAPRLPFDNATEFLQFLVGSLTRLIYLALVQALVPAAILRRLLRGDAQRLTLRSSALFGLVMGVVIMVFMTVFFWLVSVIQTGLVAPGYILTLNDFLSALMLGLAACLGVLLGKGLRNYAPVSNTSLPTLNQP